MKRILLFAALMLTALPARAAEDYSALMMQMAACESDDQCILVENVCTGWTSINKNNETSYSMLLAEQRSNVECRTGQQLPKPAGAECVNNFCAVKE